MLRDHPRGLMVLFFTEMWERFGYYTLVAVLTLYMGNTLKWSDDKAGQYYGLFWAAAYFVPIFGGFLGDRVLGQRNTIRIGAVLMMIGYAALAVSSHDRIFYFFAGLALVAAGTGLFKANISVLVGNLYEEGSKLKDAAFNIFYMGINVGALLAPLTATFIGNGYDAWMKRVEERGELTPLAKAFAEHGLSGYNIAFAAAGIGMALSLIVFQAGRRHIVPKHAGSPAAASSPRLDEKVIPWAEAKQRLLSLAILFVIVILFWVAYNQNGSALTWFAERSTADFAIKIPVPAFIATRFSMSSPSVNFALRPETYQVFNPVFIVILTPLLLAGLGWLRARGKEPSDAAKICIGFFILGLSALVMVFASLAGGDQDKKLMSPWWLISCYFVVTVGEILVSPMGLSFVSKVAPPNVRGLMMGCWFGAIAVGSYLAGWTATKYGSDDPAHPAISHHMFYLGVALIPFVGALLILPFLKRLNRFSE
jgi:proton-dependent oligopeptide transporter, POT family